MAVKIDTVAAKTAYGVAAEATNDVEFNENESFDGSNSPYPEISRLCNRS